MNRARLGLSVIAILLWSLGCSNQSFVDKIVIDNPTAYKANVSVTSGARRGWLGLTTVGARSQETVEQVYDQGSTWLFSFSYSDYEEEVELSRADLVRSEWRVEVPESFEDALRARGVTPPP